MKNIARFLMTVAMASLMASCALSTATTHSDAIADGSAKQKAKATGVARTGLSVGGFAGAGVTRGD